MMENRNKSNMKGTEMNLYDLIVGLKSRIDMWISGEISTDELEETIDEVKAYIESLGD